MIHERFYCTRRSAVATSLQPAGSPTGNVSARSVEPVVTVYLKTTKLWRARRNLEPTNKGRIMSEHSGYS
ncbi:MAG: hypothetical protein OJF47_000488 [Nitrospira sp.]|jgi:hypothetical protein|nr:MAG: hypothetical protein OJF47_000488 [Nitrospira sp.]